MPSKKEFSVVIASDLRSGRSVYYTADSTWTTSVADADLLTDGQSEIRLQDALSDERANLVIDPYLVSMSDAVSAVEIRERIRVAGPSILKQPALLAGDSKAA